ncbi:hypothetical protein BC936DRAFT_146848 [Jimgerdemannia flammicorona]|uniref:Uncharacterized protein n=2 Tax=Jimgerdemannia flammicorona TaxID=994334 RepID=A0A433DL76_9FUNG|nr:hypothetical protein BC936DRAFT_146848 [Jimgerdemannia flammicorona]RUS34666.1 hypothetical protein BC938DRAFT_479222 [Jimgerdemannia flammicorona]
MRGHQHREHAQLSKRKEQQNPPSRTDTQGRWFREAVLLQKFLPALEPISIQKGTVTSPAGEELQARRCAQIEKRSHHSDKRYDIPERK